MRWHGDTRGPGPGARHCQEEVPQPPDGGHPDLVPVQDQGVRSSNKRKYKAFYRNIKNIEYP